MQEIAKENAAVEQIGYFVTQSFIKIRIRLVALSKKK